MPLSGNFPAPIGANSYKFALVEPLLGSGYPGITRLSPADIPFITTEIVSYGGGVTAPGYFVVSPSMLAYAEEFGQATAAQCRTFVAAMDRAPAGASCTAAVVRRSTSSPLAPESQRAVRERPLRASRLPVRERARDHPSQFGTSIPGVGG